MVHVAGGIFTTLILLILFSFDLFFFLLVKKYFLPCCQTGFQSASLRLLLPAERTGRNIGTFCPDIWHRPAFSVVFVCVFVCFRVLANLSCVIAISLSL